MTFTLYHNINCSKSRACFDILKKKKINFLVREYTKKPLSILEIKDLVTNLEGDKKNLIRDKKIDFELINLVDYIHKNSKMMQRPIFYNGVKYIICRPPEKVLDYVT